MKFLVQPFLESPESLSVDCEMSQTLKRAWVRIAFNSIDKEKVFGRGGRNIQAIRTVISAAAELAGNQYTWIFTAAVPTVEIVCLLMKTRKSGYYHPSRKKERAIFPNLLLNHVYARS